MEAPPAFADCGRMTAEQTSLGRFLTAGIFHGDQVTSLDSFRQRFATSLW